MTPKPRCEKTGQSRFFRLNSQRNWIAAYKAEL